MRELLLLGVLLVGIAIWYFGATGDGEAGRVKGKLLSHDVYFSLKDKSPEAAQKLVAACKKYLTKHDGEVFFAAGVLCDDLKREVNDLNFDVALHIVFASKEAHDKYQVAERHEAFIKENKDSWSKVRVFDSYVER